MMLTILYVFVLHFDVTDMPRSIFISQRNFYANQSINQSINQFFNREMSKRTSTCETNTKQ